MIKIAKNDFGVRTDFPRDSSFQRRDIEGTLPKSTISKRETASNFSLSTYVEPIPNRFKKINKLSDSMNINDI